ncbi:MAG: hypothetical protein ACI9GW_001975 [Halieaceae bacterium]|jgi:hypothetical protein
MYTVEGLENGIVGCRKNIETLEVAIEAERATIASYRKMMEDIDTAARIMAAAEANIHLEIVRDDSPE